MKQWWGLMLIGALLLVAEPTSQPLTAQTLGRYFPETGHTVQGGFWQYWQGHGGLMQQGYPLSEEFPQASELDPGKTYIMQYFERAVLEYHPENTPPYDVLLTQLGMYRYRARYPKGALGQQASADRPRFFPETGHTIGGVFRAYWESHGGLAQQGYPISEEFREASDLDPGKSYRVQYFERAVFEYHPENLPPYDVLLTQLGRLALAERPPAEGTDACYAWTNQIPLQTAINQYTCVEMQPGTWTTTRQISLTPGHRLRGKNRDTTILQAAIPWAGNGVNNGAEALIHNNGSLDVAVANLTVDANNLSTAGVGYYTMGQPTDGMLIDSLRVINAKCDGLTIAGPGLTVRNSVIEHNGTSACPKLAPGSGRPLPGSGIYVVKQEGVINSYAPLIQGNLIRANGGPGLDVNGVWGGIFRDNTVVENQAWTAVSLYSAGQWIIDHNQIHQPAQADPWFPNHASCQDGPQGDHPAGLTLCQDVDAADRAVVDNVVSDNAISGFYGIRALGDDSPDHQDRVPRRNQFLNNDVYGAQVGCVDDFEPRKDFSAANIWRGNNCDGTPDSLPVYYAVLCPSAVRQATVDQWRVGEVDDETLRHYIDRFNTPRTGGGNFAAGAPIPAGVVIATDFTLGGRAWSDFPVQPLVHHGGWGLFATVEAFAAPYQGACLSVVP